MRVLDIFSYLPAKELSIEQIEDIFLKFCDGIINDTYKVVHELPDNADGNTVELKKELLQEEKQVAYILRQSMIVSVVGYRN